MSSGTYTRATCTLCWNEGIYNETYLGTYGLCTQHLKQYTNTGTVPLPNWLREFISFHNNDERKMYHSEIPFSLLDENEKPTQSLE
jgi:hypothetical protein